MAPPPKDASKLKLLARHFESLGQVIMRSGWGPDDTYCLFTIGSRVPSHKQYDEGNQTSAGKDLAHEVLPQTGLAADKG